MRMIVAAILLASVAPAFASEPAPKPEKKPPPKASSLVGNDLPHCEPGTYPAGHMCKPAPPGYYAPASTRYPVPCPAGKTSPYGARGLAECK